MHACIWFFCFVRYKFRFYYFKCHYWMWQITHVLFENHYYRRCPVIVVAFFLFSILLLLFLSISCQQAYTHTRWSMHVGIECSAYISIAFIFIMGYYWWSWFARHNRRSGIGRLVIGHWNVRVSTAKGKGLNCFMRSFHIAPSAVSRCYCVFLSTSMNIGRG